MVCGFLYNNAAGGKWRKVEDGMGRITVQTPTSSGLSPTPNVVLATILLLFTQLPLSVMAATIYSQQQQLLGGETKKIFMEGRE